VKMIKTNSLITFAFAITMIAMVIGILGTMVHPTFASQDAYSRGQRDAIRDYHGLNGHGFDDSCPSGHSASYCSNYHNGYSTQWAVSSNSDMLNGGDGTGYTDSTQSQSQTQTQTQSQGPDINIHIGPSQSQSQSQSQAQK
jgi:hypothetical protein